LISGHAKENWMKKSQNMSVGSAQWFWPSIFPRNVEAGKKAKQNLTLTVDCLDSLIGPSGLLLVV
jgi:hypothetical protein